MTGKLSNLFDRSLKIGDLLDELNERARTYAKGGFMKYSEICKQTLKDFALQIEQSGRKFIKAPKDQAETTGVYFVEMKK